MKCSKARLGRVELVWAKVAKHEKMQKRIVKWKCKGVNPEGNQAGPPVVGRSLWILIISKRDIYLEVRWTRPAKLTAEEFGRSR